MENGAAFKAACEAGDVAEFKRLLGELLHAIGNQGLSSASAGPPLSPSASDTPAGETGVGVGGSGTSSAAAGAGGAASPTRGPRSPLGSMATGNPTRQQLRDKEKLLAMKRAKLKACIVGAQRAFRVWGGGGVGV